MSATFSIFYSFFFVAYNLLVTSMFKLLSVSFVNNFINLHANADISVSFTKVLSASNLASVNFSSKNITTSELINSFSFLEHSGASHRALRFSNALIGYDYKTGHYLGSSEKFYPQLILSFIEVARGIRKPSWVFSDQYLDLLSQNYNSYFTNFTGKINLKLASVED
jgi:hypothetical protein